MTWYVYAVKYYAANTAAIGHCMIFDDSVSSLLLVQSHIQFGTDM